MFYAMLGLVVMATFPLCGAIMAAANEDTGSAKLFDASDARNFSLLRTLPSNALHRPPLAWIHQQLLQACGCWRCGSSCNSVSVVHPCTARSAVNHIFLGVGWISMMNNGRRTMEGGFIPSIPLKVRCYRQHFI